MVDGATPSLDVAFEFADLAATAIRASSALATFDLHHPRTSPYHDFVVVARE
jgi:hypothetical protein